ncbi:MAG: flavoprotein [Bacteroidetes bacterium GWF2_40_14]|nr:MAG: flavoprotein [Bacteroidetes bacterium GWF2_40_14]
MNIGIIGGGAAGFFAAITAKERYPSARVSIFEKSLTLLSKVRVSGGGRCNLTNGCTNVDELCKAYPRGGRQLKKAFHTFGTVHTMEWFESRGVPLVIHEDNCVFPVSQNSLSIVDCLISEAKRLGVEINTGMGVKALRRVDEDFGGKKGNKLELTFFDDELSPEIFDKIIVTTGGSPRRDGLDWLEDLGHKIEYPVPSLFTFNMPAEPVTELMGVVVENVVVGIQGTKMKANGPLLVTHWGMSGPAILKLSSFGARILNEASYNFRIQINWANEQNNDIVSAALQGMAEEHPHKLLSNIRPYSLPSRLWLYLLEKSDLSPDKKWIEVGKKGINRLTTTLTNDEYTVKGKSAFREEFVTCGGVSLQSVDMGTMQSKVCKNLYFAGEVLDIDAITGGYNLQCAWTTGYVAGLLQGSDVNNLK